VAAFRSRESLPTPAEAGAAFRRELRRNLRILVGVLALLWLILAVDALAFGGGLRQWGIEPRTVRGLRGLLVAPLLHSGVGHLLGNSVGFAMLGGLVLMREAWHFWTVTAVGALVGGLATWLFGRPPMHIGASGVIFAYFGYLLVAGWLERKLGAIILSLFVFMTWGTLLFGVLPGQIGISWEGHLFGLVGGILAAALIARRRTSRA
jgi:membrane associated rhomboid family serine protease